jgi:hypothetical protein
VQLVRPRALHSGVLPAVCLKHCQDRLYRHTVQGLHKLAPGVLSPCHLDDCTVLLRPGCQSASGSWVHSLPRLVAELAVVAPSSAGSHVLLAEVHSEQLPEPWFLGSMLWSFFVPSGVSVCVMSSSITGKLGLILHH